jgi:mRNA-degrading endonuclease RelE of RelBE toxin-antitoxin system
LKIRHRERVKRHTPAHFLLPPLDDRFSARRGTYRIICRMDEQNRVVTVVDVDHRRDIYRA